MTTHGGRKSAGLDAIAWAARATELGAGEILLNAMDADGTQDGFDLELIRAVRREVTIPVIASGGAGRVDHFAPAVDAGADAVLAATVFHFGTLRIGEVKAALADAGHPRLAGAESRVPSRRTGPRWSSVDYRRRTGWPPGSACRPPRPYWAPTVVEPGRRYSPAGRACRDEPPT